MDSGLDFFAVAKVLLRPAIKDFTLQALVKQTKDSLEIMETIVKHQKKYEQVELHLSGLLLLEDPETLALNKLLIDIKNIKHYLEKIATKQTSILIIELMGCLKVVDIIKKRTKEFKEREKTEQRLHHQIEQDYNIWLNAFENASRKRDRKIEKLSRTLIEIPYIFHTSMNTLSVEYTMAEHKIKQNEIKLAEELRQLKNLSLNMQAAHIHVIRYYEIEIRNLQEKVKYWTEKFDNDYEDHNHEVVIYALRVKNLSAKWLELQESMITMELEIQHMLQKLKEEELLKSKLEEETQKRLTKQVMKKPQFKKIRKGVTKLRK